jgi:hypothetical protein
VVPAIDGTVVGAIACSAVFGRLVRAKERGGDREGRGWIAQRPSRLVEASQRDHPPGDGVA